MGHWIDAEITSKAAAKLLISGEMSVAGQWGTGMAQKVLIELIRLPIEEILKIVDCNLYGNIVDIKYIPQFGKIDTIMRVPYYFQVLQQSSADYPQMGFYLKQDINANLMANTKFGENYGKAASILGVTSCANKRIMPSVFTEAFCELDCETQHEVFRKLIFRVPIIQVILKSATEGPFNGYSPMSQLKESTMKRRGQCIRAMLRELYKYQNEELNMRIENVIWKDCGDEQNEKI